MLVIKFGTPQVMSVLNSPNIFVIFWTLYNNKIIFGFVAYFMFSINRPSMYDRADYGRPSYRDREERDPYARPGPEYYSRGSG